MHTDAIVQTVQLIDDFSHISARWPLEPVSKDAKLPMMILSPCGFALHIRNQHVAGQQEQYLPKGVEANTSASARLRPPKSATDRKLL